jgi:hypothetical protein
MSKKFTKLHNYSVTGEVYVLTPDHSLPDHEDADLDPVSDSVIVDVGDFATQALVSGAVRRHPAFASMNPELAQIRIMPPLPPDLYLVQQNPET